MNIKQIKSYDENNSKRSQLIFCAHSNMNKIEKFIKRYYY